MSSRRGVFVSVSQPELSAPIVSPSVLFLCRTILSLYSSYQRFPKMWDDYANWESRNVSCYQTKSFCFDIQQFPSFHALTRPYDSNTFLGENQHFVFFETIRPDGDFVHARAPFPNGHSDDLTTSTSDNHSDLFFPRFDPFHRFHHTCFIAGFTSAHFITSFAAFPTSNLVVTFL